MTVSNTISWTQVQQHDKEDDLWLIIADDVWDMTAFAAEHPGGSEIIQQYAGRDATHEYSSVHAPSLVRKELGSTSAYIGKFDMTTMPAEAKQQQQQQQQQSQPQQQQQQQQNVQTNTTAVTLTKPPLDEIINLHDFELAARTSFTPKAWAYISGASNDNITRDLNASLLSRIFLRPHIMRNVSSHLVNTSTTIFGCKLSMPVYMSPTGAVKMAGGEGELDQARAADAMGIIQCFATPSSFPHEEILEATPSQAWFQLYVDKNREKSEEAIRRAEGSGKVKALFVTVDCPVISKREADERVGHGGGVAAGIVGQQKKKKDKKGSGFTRQASGFIDAGLSWDDIPWLRRTTRLPIVIKGIQRWEDAVVAMQRGVDGIVISNHGGRAVDTAPPGIVVLLELRRHCPEVFERMKVFVDGGFRRGSDVLKAICLGASAVGLGRPFMYAVNYGQEGVEHCAEVLLDEIRTAMQLCGITDLMKEAGPGMVNTQDVDHLVYAGTRLIQADKAKL